MPNKPPKSSPHTACGSEDEEPKEKENTLTLSREASPDFLVLGRGGGWGKSRHSPCFQSPPALLSVS